MDKTKTKTKKLEEREGRWRKFLSNRLLAWGYAFIFVRLLDLKEKMAVQLAKESEDRARTVAKRWRNLEGERHKRKSLKICIWILLIFLDSVCTQQDVGNIQELRAEGNEQFQLLPMMEVGAEECDMRR